MPIVFKWPGGDLSSFFKTQTLCASPELGHWLDRLVGDVLATGCVLKVHLLGHSMGCRLVMHCLCSSRFGRETFGQVLLAQPELALEDFRASCGDMSAHCETITVYVNAGDVALFGAEFFSRRHYEAGDEAEGAGAALCRCLGLHSLIGRALPSLGRASTGSLLDHATMQPFPRLDIIDTSSVHSNVEGIRHSFFHLSRETLDDIKEVLVSGRRAKERRGRLVLRDHEGNIYDVCVAPSTVR